tara:strand:+ start:182 stop:424 length:243 start_codon:yes stop_codon:yes gene_type:complete
LVLSLLLERVGEYGAGLEGFNFTFKRTDSGVGLREIISYLENVLTNSFFEPKRIQGKAFGGLIVIVFGAIAFVRDGFAAN